MTPSLILSASYGRLYASGEMSRRLMTLPGATLNERRRAVELSLTVETMRGIRDTLGLTREQLAAACPPPVLAWARVAAANENAVREMHTRLERGERVALPWTDNGWQTATPAATGPRAPFDHQRIMATAACWLDGVYYNADPGTGKTRGALAAMEERTRRGEVDVWLVICPRRAGKTWADEVPCWSNELRCQRLTSGPVSSRRQHIERASRGTVLVINIEVLAKCAPSIAVLQRRCKVGLVVDEAHKFKNPTAQRTKALLDLAPRFPARIGMSGSPVLQGVQDVWSQWYVTDLGLTFGANFVQYRREHLEEDPYTMELSARAGAELVVGQRMRKRGLRFAKDDCLDLPPKLYTTYECDMAPEQRSAYDRMAEELVAMMGNDDEFVADAANQLARILRLTQITSGHVKLEDGSIYRFATNPKLDTLEEVVRESPRGSARIIWARYREDVRAIAERLHDLRPVIIQGGMSDDDTDRAQDMFNDGTTDTLIGNQKAGSSSLNLQRADTAYYFSQDYALEDRVQSEDRCHRAGSERHARVLYGDLACTQSIDAVISASLQGKQDVASLVSNLRRALRAPACAA